MEVNNIQTLKLAEDVFDELSKGKLCTIRKGRRDIKLGELLFESVEVNRNQLVTVEKVIYCELQHIPEQYIKNDGFKDHADMMITMVRFYPDITWFSECTIIDFKIK